MPKLLSQEEATHIAAKMAEAYGLPSPRIEENSYNGGWNVRLEILRQVKVKRVSKWFKVKSIETVHTSVSDLYAQNYEDALSKLEVELNKFNSRTSIAERFREKFAMEEADAVLDDILKKPAVPII